MSKFNSSQKKRPFQPSLDSYFHHASEEINSLGITPHHDTAIPRLPTAVQSSLLNVGMRVRKSIPEGYKICAKNWSGSATDTENRLGAVIEPCLPAIHAASRPRELMPHCGILYVGGHANQRVMVENDLTLLEFDPDDSDLIMSSQESATTTSVSIESTCSKKRPWDDLNDCSDLQPVESP